MGIIKKSALEIYRTFKQEIAKESIYDNTRGSSLLFEARTGVLRTKTYRAKYEVKSKGSKPKAEVPEPAPAVAPRPSSSDDETTDEEGVPYVPDPGNRAKAGWGKFREAFKKSSGFAGVAENGDDGNSVGPQPSRSYQCGGLTFTPHVSPPAPFNEQRGSNQHPFRVCSPSFDAFPWLSLPIWLPSLPGAGERKPEPEEERAAERDPRFSFSFVRDTLLKYERVDDWLKDVHHGYLKLARWKQPYYTGAFLAAVKRVQSRRKFNVDIVSRMLKLNMRVSKSFQVISTAFDKTHSLLTWKNPGTTLCLLIALLVLVGIAFWQGQAFAVQITVTLILLKLFVADYLCHVYPEAAKYDLISRAWNQLPGLLSNTLGFRSTGSRGSLSGHSAAITSRTIGQRLPVPTWLAHTRSGMSEPEAVSVQPPMAGSHPGPGDSPRSNGSTFSPDGDRALLDVDLQNAPVTSVPAIPDVTNIQLPAAAGEAQNGRLPAESGQMMQASFHRVIAHQKQIHDILFDASCKVPNTHRSQIIGLLRQIVQECADIRAIAENQGGRMDELRHQLALSRYSASLGAALSAPRPVQTAVTYAAAAARSTARPTVVPPVWPETCSHPVLPSHWSEIADQHTTHTTRREHEHIMFLTPLIPSTNPANEVTKIIKSNIDPMRENIGELTIRKTRHGLTILTNDHNAITRLKNALEKNAITSMSLSVRLPQKRKPRVKLTGVDSDIPAANIISQLNMRNPNLHLDPTTCRVAVSYKERSGNFTHVLEVDPPTCRSLLAQERVLLGWTACSVLPASRAFGNMVIACGNMVVYASNRITITATTTSPPWHRYSSGSEGKPAQSNFSALSKAYKVQRHFSTSSSTTAGLHIGTLPMFGSTSSRARGTGILVPRFLSVNHIAHSNLSASQRWRRISRSFTRLPNTAATSSCEDELTSHRQSSPASEITRIVRREIEAITPALPSNGHVDSQVPQVCLVQSIVQEELSNLGFDVCAVAQCRPFGFRSRSPPRARLPPQERSFPRSRNPPEWRTADDRPICFNCRRIGHVARYCRNHWSSSPTQYNTARCADSYRLFQPPAPIPDGYRRLPPFDASNTQHSRSPSPRRHQSRSPPARRPSSPSPLRRRPTSPPNSHQGN
ncbi:hypothetical protein HPB51_007336 [Rhipicephalus microplus]|uniref:CCHC-type domain-containing protein n=1 Tax=Rhipicephalus microplus TaxID=6941 RepID=A0A9J6EYE3_RHIMP|nr:hypothetical protein HPB51_007336 [Rhipicephalus microplus]